jgi:hypothetical protein
MSIFGQQTNGKMPVLFLVIYGAEVRFKPFKKAFQQR